MKKVSNKLAVIIIAMLTISFGLFAVLGYSNSKDAILNISEDSKQMSSVSANIYAQEFFGSRVFAVENFVKHLEENPYILEDKEELKEELLMATLAVNVAEFYVGFADNGEVYDAIVTPGKKTEVVHLTPQKDNFDARTKVWYQKAMAKNGLIFTEPYIAQTTGKRYITITKPINIKGRNIGVVAADISLDDIGDNVAKMKDSDTGTIFIVGMDGAEMIYNPDKSAIMSQDNAVKNISREMIENFRKDSKSAFYFKNQNGIERIGACELYPLPNWLICSSNSVSDYDSILNSVLTQQSMFSLLFIFIIVTVLVFAINY
ncbi:cache domain-containing protein, partial [Campylobacter mucosalis]